MKLCVLPTIWLKLMKSFVSATPRTSLVLLMVSMLRILPNVGVLACATIPSIPLQLDILFYAKDLIDTHFFTRMYMYIAITGKNRSNTSISKEKYTFVTNLIDKLYFHAKIKWRAKINC